MEQQELISTGVADIATSLGIAPEHEEKVAAPDAPESEAEAPVEGEDAPPAENQDGEEAQPEEGAEQPPIEVAPPPKSWGKDTHEIWAKIPPDAQAQILKREEQMLDGLAAYKEYSQVGKAMNDVISPYRPMLQAAGLDDAKAVAVLLQAHYRLTHGSPESRKSAYLQLGRSMGFVPQAQAGDGQQGAAPVDQEARQALQVIQQHLRNQEAARLNATRQQVTQEFEAFAKDAPFIDDVATEVVAFINAGDDLKIAYEKAVWANPVTRAKEQARLDKEREQKLKEKTRAAAEAARKAKAGNVRGRDTERAPTGPLGKMEDTMRETLREIESRAH